MLGSLRRFWRVLLRAGRAFGCVAVRVLRAPAFGSSVAAAAVVIAAVSFVQSNEANARAASLAKAQSAAAVAQSDATQRTVASQIDLRNLIFCQIIDSLPNPSLPLRRLYVGLECPRLLAAFAEQKPPFDRLRPPQVLPPASPATHP